MESGQSTILFSQGSSASKSAAIVAQSGALVGAGHAKPDTQARHARITRWSRIGERQRWMDSVEGGRLGRVFVGQRVVARTDLHVEEARAQGATANFIELSFPHAVDLQVDA
jgi:hypothetical protein